MTYKNKVKTNVEKVTKNDYSNFILRKIETYTGNDNKEYTRSSFIAESSDLVWIRKVESLVKFGVTIKSGMV